MANHHSEKSAVQAPVLSISFKSHDPVHAGMESIVASVNEDLQREVPSRLKPELIHEDESPDVNVGVLHDESCNKKLAGHTPETIEGGSLPNAL
jgi:hypothetical protein